MDQIGQALVSIRLELGYRTAKDFFNYLKGRGLECNYQHFVKIEKNICLPSNILINQMANGLPKEKAEELIQAFGQTIFPQYGYMFAGGKSKKILKTKTSKKLEISSGQKVLSIKQVSSLATRKENYYLFLILTLSRTPIEIEELKSLKNFKKVIKDLTDSGIVVVEDNQVRSTASEFKFPKEKDTQLEAMYAQFDLWDIDFSTDFNFETLINKMMTRRISPRYMSVILKQIDGLADLVRLADESDQTHNTEVIHLHLKVQKGELPG